LAENLAELLFYGFAYKRWIKLGSGLTAWSMPTYMKLLSPASRDTNSILTIPRPSHLIIVTNYFTYTQNDQRWRIRLMNDCLFWTFLNRLSSPHFWATFPKHNLMHSFWRKRVGQHFEFFKQTHLVTLHT
jgi:hypothetical protein